MSISIHPRAYTRRTLAGACGGGGGAGQIAGRGSGRRRRRLISSSSPPGRGLAARNIAVHRSTPNRHAHLWISRGSNIF
ncbi:hypothetical protein SORBI_3003G073620 [Sorghum bicolor]|uniref:Uncharacterized protein n=1 Tax=Sorghum bicolor TaxID=4558 RepID=A0A1W0VW22_SORBI|nr:hypothetical protein SORBI_3003G073620 [Sorghum bicolor]